LQVLFVCTANVCRSPMAEAIFNVLAEDREFLPFRAESAGTAALEGRPMDPNAVATFREAGIYPEPRRARRVGGATFTVSSTRPSIKDLSTFKPSTGRSFT
jgi:protein-tyrosine-phosphatase